MFLFRRINLKNKIPMMAIESTNKYANSIKRATPSQPITIYFEKPPSNNFYILILLGLPLFYYINKYYGGKHASINN